MEDKKESVISSNATDEIVEPSDSNSATQPCAASKSAWPGPSGAASRFKGVVLQQNGHWGAQIYANHQRIWLGTFRTENEAAMAYDSAAIKVRAGDSFRNFPWTSINIAEPEFQSHFSTEAVLGMIKDGTYPFKFTEYLSKRGSNQEISERVLSTVRLHENKGVTWRLMFQKELTPSDVGKLNRVVIPKRYALKYFPAISGLGDENTENDHKNSGENSRDVELVFYDGLMKTWRFRYCYWTSSQSFVLTRGWNQFVKENKLRAKDVIVFFTCEYRENDNKLTRFCVINVSKAENKGALIEKHPAKRVVQQDEDLKLGLGFSKHIKVEEYVKVTEEEEEEDDEDDKEEEEEETVGGGEKKGFKLFGVRII